MSINILDYSKTPDKVETGEEWLHQTYNCTKGDAVKCLIGVDAGSTQTRVTILSAEDVASEDIHDQVRALYSIPSTYREPSSTSMPVPVGTNIWCNMHSRIIKNSTPNFERVEARILRGDLIEDVYGITSNRFETTRPKIDFDDLYYNIIDAIGYASIAKFNGVVPSVIQCWIGVALPPEDLSSETNRARFKERMCGTFEWWSSLGCEITIKVEDVISQSEPLAQMTACYAMDEVSKVESYRMVIETGGRSTGVIILNSNNRALEGMTRTLSDGGSKIIKLFRDMYRDKNGGQPPSMSACESAVRTGLLKDGSSSVDVVEMVAQAKRLFIDGLIRKLGSEIFNGTDIQYRDIEEVCLGGRVFTQNEGMSSLFDIFIDKFSELSPNTEYRMPSMNMVPAGMVLKTLKEFGKHCEYI